jgi:predicted RNase H-like HicB family nuclease
VKEPNPKTSKIDEKWTKDFHKRMAKAKAKGEKVVCRVEVKSLNEVLKEATKIMKAAMRGKVPTKPIIRNYIDPRQVSDLAKYEVEWSREDETFVASAPEFPGCKTHGLTPLVAIQRCREAVIGYVESLTKRKLPLPSSIEFKLLQPFRDFMKEHLKTNKDILNYLRLAIVEDNPEELKIAVLQVIEALTTKRTKKEK